MPKSKIQIYTDGAAKGNPGNAGWAAVILLSQNNSGQGGIYEIGGRKEHATNNQMELTAPIEALKYLKTKMPKTPFDIEIISDSKYVILGITEWIMSWQKNGWRNANKKPVLNRELWEELYKLTKEITCPPERRELKWTYVKGHNEDKYNDRADLIATSFAEDAPVELEK
jgi:ribonuclease HI